MMTPPLTAHDPDAPALRRLRRRLLPRTQRNAAPNRHMRTPLQPGPNTNGPNQSEVHA